MKVHITLNLTEDGKPKDDTFGMVCEWPENWHEMDPKLFMMAYWEPTIEQLRNEAKCRAEIQAEIETGPPTV